MQPGHVSTDVQTIGSIQDVPKHGMICTSLAAAVITYRLVAMHNMCTPYLEVSSYCHAQSS